MEESRNAESGFCFSLRNVPELSLRGLLAPFSLADVASLELDTDHSCMFLLPLLS